MKDAALLFFAIVAIGLAIIILREHREQFAVEAPVIPSAQSANVVPWRLRTLCIVTSRNVPPYQKEIRT